MNRLSEPSPILLPVPPVPAARSSRIGRLPEIDLAAHDEADEIVGRQNARQARRILRILVPRNIAGAFEVAQHGAAAGIAKRLDGRIGVLLRVVDLRDVEHRRDAGVEL